jgi:cytoskeleton protein RodZ
VEDGVGKTLRDARNKRGLDLTEVEASTRIHVRFLRALEDEDWDVLPGETYARAFIRTYADFLGLDGARLAAGHHRDSGAASPAERVPRIEPDPVVPAGRPRRLSARLVAAIVATGLVAAVVVAAVTGGDGGSPRKPGGDRSAAGQQAGGGRPPEASGSVPGASLKLTATAEVWVCLLDASGEPLVDGQILATGSEAGPFRSGSFTVSFGNGEVSMTVNGQQASIPATSSPIGYAIGAGGEMRELPEGERPTCT